MEPAPRLRDVTKTFDATRHVRDAVAACLGCALIKNEDVCLSGPTLFAGGHATPWLEDQHLGALQSSEDSLDSSL